MDSNVINESNLRNILTDIEDNILKSWLKDLDKVHCMQQLIQILTSIIHADSLNAFFKNENDLKYFLTRFSSEVLINLLRQVNVIGENGDDIALMVLLGYCRLWLKYYDNPLLGDLMTIIFDPNRAYFAMESVSARKNSLNPRKLYTAFQFNSTLPKAPGKFTVFSPGDIVDIFIDNPSSRTFIDKNVWIRGRITAIEEQAYTIVDAGDTVYHFPLDSQQVFTAGTFTKDYDWRTNLNQWDVISAYDRAKWYPATIIQAQHEQANRLRKSSYRVAFRLFPEHFPDWERYKTCWFDRELARDRNGVQYIGDSENMDEEVPFYSKRIQRLESMSASQKSSLEEEDRIVDDCYLFESNGKKFYIIGRTHSFSYYYALLLTQFLEEGGYDQLFQICHRNPLHKVMATVLSIFDNSKTYLHRDYIKSFYRQFLQILTDFYHEISAEEPSELIIDLMKLMTNILTYYTEVINDPNEVIPVIVEEMSIFTAIWKLKTSSDVDNNVDCVKGIIRYLETNQNEKNKLEIFGKIIEKQNAFELIFNQGACHKILKAGKDLLKICIKHELLTEKELDGIWKSSSQDNESQVIKFFWEIGNDFFLNEKYVPIIVRKIHSKATADITPNEIELLSQMIAIKNNNESIEETFHFFILKFLESLTVTGSTVASLNRKILDLVTKNFDRTMLLIKMCIEYLKSMDHSLMAIKLVETLITSGEFNDIPVEDIRVKFLFEDNCLVQSICANFKQYKSLALEYIHTNNINTSQEDIANTLTLFHFTHQTHIRERLNFLQMIVASKFTTFNDDVEFLYDVLCKDSICENDTKEFFAYLQKKIDNDNNHSNHQHCENQIFNIFQTQICADTHSIKSLTKEGFDAFVHLFIYWNKKNHLVEYSPTKSLIALTSPEKLFGFDLFWRIILESDKTDDIVIPGIKLMYDLFSSNEESGPGCEGLLRKCIKIIKAVNSEGSIEQMTAQIAKCLQILRFLIGESENVQCIGIRPHSAILRTGITNLAVSTGEKEQVVIRVYGNTTMSELREILSKKQNKSSETEVLYGDFNEISWKQNARTINDMNIPDANYFHLISANQKVSSEPELLINGRINPLLGIIITNWFNTFSCDNVMPIENLEIFLGEISSTLEQNLMDIYKDMYQEKDIITKEDFIAFFEAIAQNRRSLFLEILHSLGIRDDFTNENEPQKVILDKIIVQELYLPRDQLSQNEEFFGAFFSLYFLPDTICANVFDFICSLTTNLTLKKYIYQYPHSCLNDIHNPFKLIYTLQIIEAILEDFLITPEIIQHIDNIERLFSDIDPVKTAEWIEEFIKSGSIGKLIEILRMQINPVGLTQLGLICCKHVSRLLKLFIGLSLRNKYEIYRNINESQRSHLLPIPTTLLENFLKEKNLEEGIINGFDYSSFASLLISLLTSLRKMKNVEDISDVLTSCFDLLMLVISFAPENNFFTIYIQNLCEFQEIFRYGIIHTSKFIHEKFKEVLINSSTFCGHLKKYDILLFLFVDCFKFFENATSLENEESLSHTEAFFEVFSVLFQLLSTHSSIIEVQKELQDRNIHPQNLVMAFSEAIANELNNSHLNAKKMPKNLLVGCLSIITKVLANSVELKELINEKFNLTQLVLNRIILKQYACPNELTSTDEYGGYITPTSFEQEIQYPKETCYQFISSMMKNSLSNCRSFCSVSLCDDLPPSLSRNSLPKNEGCVGLYNPGKLCYMNSVLQQLFHISAFRNAILQANDNQDEDSDDNLNLNLLHQIQKMFTYHQFSSRKDYSPIGFCKAFTDYEGNPVNTELQKDALEFLNQLLSKMELSLHETRFRYLIKSIFGGKTCSQIKCSSCQATSNRFEDFLNLTLEVKFLKTLSDSFEKYIVPETISDYKCDACNNKVTISRQSSLVELPNVLIIHLQRLMFDYDSMKIVTIATELDIPHHISLKPYCLEEISNGKLLHLPQVSYKCNEYYDFDLTGVVLYSGSEGHEHHSSIVLKSPLDDKQNNTIEWFLFDDSSVKTLREDDIVFNMKNLAFLLVYQRKKKSPIKILTDFENSINGGDVISFTYDEADVTARSYDICRKVDEEEGFQIEEKDVYQKLFYDSTHKECFQLMPFNSLEKINLIPKRFYMSVTKDNLLFEKEGSIHDAGFPGFIEKCILALHETLAWEKCQNNLAKEDSQCFVTELVPLAFHYLNSSQSRELLSSTIDVILQLLDANPDCLVKTLDYIIHNPRITISQALINENDDIIAAYFRMLKTVYKKGITQGLADKSSYLGHLICGLFPRIGKKYTEKIYPVYPIFKEIIQSNSAELKSFYEQKLICVLTTYLLGKDSPCYSLYTDSDKPWESARSSTIPNTAALLDVIEILVKSSVQFNDNPFIPIDCKIFRDLHNYLLSEDEMNCLKSIHLLKLICSSNRAFYTNLILLIQTNDKEVTIRICEEISATIGNIGFGSFHKLVSLFNIIERILAIKDDFQLDRLRIIVGYPIFGMEDPDQSCAIKWPMFGAPLLSISNGNWLKYVTMRQISPHDCLLDKIVFFRSSPPDLKEFLKMLLTACSNNCSLVHYLSQIPSDEDWVMNRTILSWMIKYLQERGNNNDKDILDQLLPSVVELMTIAESNGMLTIKGFSGFTTSYLPCQITREEIKHICRGEGLHLLRLEYFTTIFANADDSKMEEFEEKPNEERKKLDDSTTIYMDITQRGESESDFLNSLLPVFGDKKTVVVEDKSITGAAMPTTLRYVLLNTTQHSGQCTIKIRRNKASSPTEGFNEFIPSDIIIPLSASLITNVFLTTKINPYKDWTSGIEDIIININLDWNQNN